MTCHNCNIRCKRFGKHRNGLQRFRCNQCRRTFTEDHDKPLGTMYTSLEDAAKAIELLVEGCSVSTAERITGIHHTTLLSLLCLAGEKCERLMAAKFRGLNPARLEFDEIWGFVAKKDKQLRLGDSEEVGSQFVFVAIDPISKLIPAFAVGKRTPVTTRAFVNELRSRLAADLQVQITTDGFRPYIPAIDSAFGADADYAMLIKSYGSGDAEPGTYAPPRITAVFHQVMWGNPTEENICTSYVERQNLTMRMHMRRLTRLTNAFSKKLANLKAALALHFAWYNFCRSHKALRMTPAMAAGITDHIWSIAELLSA